MFSGGNVIQTDYPGRLAFLYATTEAMRPAPINTLLDLMPTFSEWFSRYQVDVDKDDPWFDIQQLSALMKCKMSMLDQSAPAQTLRAVLLKWMEQHHINPDDEWIMDTALFSLGWHAFGNELKWNLLPGPAARPKLDLRLLWDYFKESLDQFRERSEQEFLVCRKEYIAKVQQLWGDRRQETPERVARWTALSFRLKYREIADRESTASRNPKNARCEDTIRKRVKEFAARIQLTLPSRRPVLTLADSLAAKVKNGP